MTDDLRPYLHLALADNIFFSQLKIEAIRRLLRDEAFDQIIFALDEASLRQGLIDGVFAAQQRCVAATQFF